MEQQTWNERLILYMLLELLPYILLFLPPPKPIPMCKTTYAYNERRGWRVNWTTSYPVIVALRPMK